MTVQDSMRIVAVQPHARGLLHEVTVNNRSVRLLFTTHALRRAARWELSQKLVLRALLLPDEVLRGHRMRFIAQKRTGGHVVRVIYEYERELPVIITVYNPLAKRYFAGGGSYEDRILA